MALTIANVTTPNGEVHEGSLMGLRARIVDITFDSSYLTGGEVLTTAMLGWDYLFGAVALTHPANSAGTLGLPTVVKANSTGTQLTFQPLESAASGDPMGQATSTQDLSAYTGRFIVLGF